jgi:hypothetical protein
MVVALSRFIHIPVGVQHDQHHQSSIKLMHCNVQLIFEKVSEKFSSTAIHDDKTITTTSQRKARVHVELLTSLDTINEKFTKKYPVYYTTEKEKERSFK